MHIQQGTTAFRRMSLALFAGGFSTFAILYCLQPLMPEFTRDFGVAPAVASLSLSMTTIAMSVAMLFVGSLSDAWGRKSIMALSLLAASVMAVVIAFSPEFHTLLGLRILQGIVLAGLPAIAMTYLTEEMEPLSLGYAMGLYISGNSIGGMAGRIVTGLLTDWFDWRVAVAVLGCLSVAAAVIFYVMLPPSQHFRQRKLEIGKVIPLLWAQCRNPRLLCLYGLGFLLMGSFVTLFNYIGYELLAAPYYLSQSLVGSIFVVYLMGTVSSTWMGRLSDRFGRGGVMRAALCIVLAGALLTLGGSLALKIIGMAIFTFGFFGAHSIASSWVGIVAQADKAQASALYLFFYYIGSSVSGTSGGLVFTRYGWDGVIGMIAIYFVLAMLLSTVLNRRSLDAQT
ncbi:MFS transporter [Paenibacillus filicis]|uniref:MFS transporter n=1 Tax=Paenibacillus filicis TaxID=669464 RepID=A0ABU9DE75_9BACL